jgi:hypothetical protein
METAFQMQSEAMQTFDISREPESVRSAYGDTPFARSCLLARRLLEDGVALGMSQDRSQAAIAKTRKAVRDLNRDAIVAKFYQQIVGFANGVEVRLLEHALQVFVGEMKIASQT